MNIVDGEEDDVDIYYVPSNSSHPPEVGWKTFVGLGVAPPPTNYFEIKMSVNERRFVFGGGCLSQVQVRLKNNFSTNHAAVSNKV
jgi:hypothetical protein